MITITKTPAGGLLLTTGSAEVWIEAQAIATALPVIIASLVDTSKALGQARQDGYDAGLIVGHANGTREAEARYLHEAAEIAASLSLIKVNAPLAA